MYIMCIYIYIYVIIYIYISVCVPGISRTFPRKKNRECEVFFRISDLGIPWVLGEDLVEETTTIYIYIYDYICI